MNIMKTMAPQVTGDFWLGVGGKKKQSIQLRIAVLKTNVTLMKNQKVNHPDVDFECSHENVALQSEKFVDTTFAQVTFLRKIHLF